MTSMTISDGKTTVAIPQKEFLRFTSSTYPGRIFYPVSAYG